MNAPIFHELERETQRAAHDLAAAVQHGAAEAAAWFHHDQPHNPDLSAVPTMATETNQEETMSALSDELHAAAERLAHFDDVALNKLEAVQGSPVTAEAFDALALLTGVSPAPVLTALVDALKALAAPQTAPAPTSGIAPTPVAVPA